MFKRFYQDLAPYINPRKVLVIYGARQVGKTTLVEHYLQSCPYKSRIVSGDDITVREVLSSEDFGKILEFCQGYDLLVIDEAQRIDNIGMGLKIIVDQNPDLVVIATGSSSFDLANKIGEPLVGRKTVLTMFALSQEELLYEYNKFELKQNLEHYLRFGTYPEVLTLPSVKEKIDYLHEMVGSYLYKDILSFNMVKNPKLLQKIVKLLAFQIGSEVSLNEIAGQVGIDVKTVSRYLDLLEKSFIIKSLQGFSRNLRKEINKKHKYYFLDLGIRNAVISFFNDLDSRNDIGQLWENFLFIERVKKHSYQKTHANMYFWRTYDQKELDIVEEQDGKLSGYELKWNSKKVPKGHIFTEIYKDANVKFINRENYLDFVT